MFKLSRFLLITLIIISFSSLTYARDICVYFTPSYAALDAIVEQINEAEETIDVAMYSFTSRPLARALLRAKKRGVKIRVILDKKASGSSNRYSKYPFLKSNGISVRFAIPHTAWGREGLMHNKFAVIDKKTVITGSANWTASAFKINDENVIIIKRYEIANVYEKEFEYLWKRSMIR